MANNASRVGETMYQTYTPAPPLSSFVEYFWHSDHHDQPLTQERALPIGRMQLIIHLDGDEQRVTAQGGQAREQVFRESLLRGPSAAWYLLQAGQRISRIGIQFTPGGAYPFFAPPAHELRDMHVPLDAVWGARVPEFCDRLRDAPTSHARFLLLEQWLLHYAVRPLARHPAVEYALQALHPLSGPWSIGQIVEEAGLSHRRFIEVFRREVGFTPSEHWRLRRFLEVARHTHGRQSASWANLAVQMGYSDQAHLIREFHTFSGLSPRAYLRLRHPQFWTYVPCADDCAASRPAPR
jgi:AraC-like DNA-binding protein